jgi:GNAT superfamily N-acetyltransferase
MTNLACLQCGAKIHPVREAASSEFAAVRALVVEGLAQRWGRYEASFNPDLESFESTYGSATVLVATFDGRIVGCGILVRDTEQIARFVRMSVSAGLQRKGVGSAILEALLERAANLGCKEVVLETTASWVSAVAFYRRHGFVETMEQDGDQHFHLILNRSEVPGESSG